jgi:hypothetical protein
VLENLNQRILLALEQRLDRIFNNDLMSLLTNELNFKEFSFLGCIQKTLLFKSDTKEPDASNFQTN